MTILTFILMAYILFLMACKPASVLSDRVFVSDRAVPIDEDKVYKWSYQVTLPPKNHGKRTTPHIPTTTSRRSYAEVQTARWSFDSSSTLRPADTNKSLPSSPYDMFPYTRQCYECTSGLNDGCDDPTRVSRWAVKCPRGTQGCLKMKAPGSPLIRSCGNPEDSPVPIKDGCVNRPNVGIICSCSSISLCNKASEKSSILRNVIYLFLVWIPTKLVRWRIF